MISDKTIAQIVQQITNLSEEKKQNLYKFFLELKNSIKNNQFDITEEIENIKTYVNNKINETINDLINGAPEAYDTLKEIADKLVDNDDVVVQILTAISERLKISDYKEPSQSDYNENDNSKIEYIKNRPFYEENGEVVKKLNNKFLEEIDFLTDEEVELLIG